MASSSTALLTEMGLGKVLRVTRATGGTQSGSPGLPQAPLSAGRVAARISPPRLGRGANLLPLDSPKQGPMHPISQQLISHGLGQQETAPQALTARCSEKAGRTTCKRLVLVFLNETNDAVTKGSCCTRWTAPVVLIPLWLHLSQPQ